MKKSQGWLTWLNFTEFWLWRVCHMKLFQVLIVTLVSTTLLYSSGATARGKEKEICACASQFIDAIADHSCVDRSMFSKTSQGRGYFYAALGWESDGSCGLLVSDGQVSYSECAVSRVGTIDSSGACNFDGFAATSEVTSKQEGRACVTFLRDIDRYLESLPPCAP